MISEHQLITTAKKQGVIKKDEIEIIAPTSREPQVDKLSYQAFNKNLGWPYSEKLDKPVPLTSYQIEYMEAIDKKHKVILNKSRKAGFTEAFLRFLAQNVLTKKYKGYNVIIIAGNKVSVSLKLLSKLNDFFKTVEGFKDQNGDTFLYDDIIDTFHRSDPMHILFKNGTRVYGSSAPTSDNSDPFRGYDRVKCVFVTEAAFVGANDDSHVLTALAPLISNMTDGDFILESTPNGRRGFFHDFTMDASDNLKKHNAKEAIETRKKVAFMGDNGYYYLQIPYTYGIKEGVLNEEYVKSVQNNPRIDFEQEYCCAFTTSSHAAFMPLEADMFQEEEVEDLSYLLK